MLLAYNTFISEDFHAVSETSPERVISKTGPCICDLQDVLSCISLIKEKKTAALGGKNMCIPVQMFGK